MSCETQTLVLQMVLVETTSRLNRSWCAIFLCYRQLAQDRTGTLVMTKLSISNVCSYHANMTKNETSDVPKRRYAPPLLQGNQTSIATLCSACRHQSKNDSPVFVLVIWLRVHLKHCHRKIFISVFM